MASGIAGATVDWGRRESRRTGMSVRAVWATVLAPVVVLALLMVLIALPPTREATLGQLGENRPVEMLTVVTLLAAAVLAALEARRCLTRAERGRALFFALFCLGAFVTAMEEIAWGQLLLGFDTPEALAEVNVQGETTLHNIGGLQGRSELFRILAGGMGLAGVLLHRSQRLRDLAVPRVLAPLFAVILLKSLSDVAVDVMTLPDRVVFANRRLSEYIELLIGVGALLYAWLVTRRRRAGTA